MSKATPVPSLSIIHLVGRLTQVGRSDAKKQSPLVASYSTSRCISARRTRFTGPASLFSCISVFPWHDVVTPTMAALVAACVLCVIIVLSSLQVRDQRADRDAGRDEIPCPSCPFGVPERFAWLSRHAGGPRSGPRSGPLPSAKIPVNQKTTGGAFLLEGLTPSKSHEPRSAPRLA